MTNALPRLATGLWLLLLATQLQAANELALYVFRDNIPAEGLTVALDGDEEKLIAGDGGVFFDLNPGVHSIQIRDNGDTLHTFRFDSVSGQYAVNRISLWKLVVPIRPVEWSTWLYGNSVPNVSFLAATWEDAVSLLNWRKSAGPI